MAKILNEPEFAGYELGFHLARFADTAPQIAERCFTCAFRQGTDPNGCVTTVMDAMKCVMEGVPFYCHERPTKLCGGYVVLRAENTERHRTFWPFSDEIEPVASPSSTEAK